jgi:dUTP pyrophosphatase
VAGPVDAPPFDAPPHDSSGDRIVEAGVDVLLTRVDSSVPVPDYAHPDDAGVDLSCTEDVVRAIFAEAGA